METLYTVITNKTRICLWLAHELLAKFRLELKKLGKTAKKKKKKK